MQLEQFHRETLRRRTKPGFNLPASDLPKPHQYFQILTTAPLKEALKQLFVFDVIIKEVGKALPDSVLV